MASWILVPCLQRLRFEFDQAHPGRDRASDGSIGDQAHAQSSSDHNPDETGVTPYEDGDDRNEVHAIDVDKDLRGPNTDPSVMQAKVNVVVLRHRNGLDDRLQNVIYNRRIWSRSWGWTARSYTGANAHTQHAHFSARYVTSRENDTSSWFVYIPPAAPKEWSDTVTEAEFKQAMLEVLQSPAGQAAIVKAMDSPGGQAATQGAVHDLRFGRGTQTLGQALQPLQGQIGALLAYAAAEAAEVPPTAQQIAEETIARLPEQPAFDPSA